MMMSVKKYKSIHRALPTLLASSIVAMSACTTQVDSATEPNSDQSVDNLVTQTQTTTESLTDTQTPTDSETVTESMTDTQTPTDSETITESMTQTETESETVTQTITETETEVEIEIPPIFTVPARIEAEYFGRYFDTEGLNKGRVYRTDQGVDIQVCEDTDCGYNIAWTEDGEWLEYDISVESTGVYEAQIRLATPNDSSHLNALIDGNIVGNHLVRSTTAWQVWDTQTINLGLLSQGDHTLRLNIITGGVNINWLDIVDVSDANTPQGCTEINSLEALAQYLDVSDACIKMQPGTYQLDTSNVGEGLLFSNPSVLLFTGSNNTFIFDGVTFEYDTNVFRQFGRLAVWEFHVVGNNNQFRNLTIVDIGNIAPYQTAESIIMDGEDNLIDGFSVTVRGSYPYGYGDIFGKGSTRVLNHRKHAGVLLRGERNHLKDLALYMRAYGHGVFVQGGNDVLIEGVYVEGELSTVNAVLAEAGTGTDADNVDFLTVWGFNLDEQTENYHFSLQEDGIRSYADGLNYATGETKDSGNVSVIDSKVKFMRSGVTIGWARGEKFVDNATVLGNESGFWVGSNATVLNSRGDTSVGPLISEDVYRNDSNIEVTILDNVIEKIGNTPSFYIAGNGHDITIKDGTTTVDSGINIQVGGIRYGHRWLSGSVQLPPEFAADNIALDNQSEYPVTLENTSSSTSGTSCGAVTDLGMNNDVQTCD